MASIVSKHKSEYKLASEEWRKINNVMGIVWWVGVAGVRMVSKYKEKRAGLGFAW